MSNAKEGSNNFIIGFLIGAVSMLPGISAGVIAVIFNVYERLIDDINHLRVKIKEDLLFIATLGTGILLGLLVFVYVTDFMMDLHMLAAMFFFVGLIIGQLPDLVKITKKGEPTKRSHLAWLSLGLAVMIALLILELFVGEGGGEAVIENSGLAVGIVLSFAAGAILAISKIIPGISGSTVLLALGLFSWMLAIIKEFDIIYLVPFAAGFIVAVFAFAKIMWHIIEKHHHPLYYFILGLTVGSIILITAISYDMIGDLTDILIGCGAAVIGIIVGLAFGMLRRNNKAEET
jgi:putative membrane protein